MAEARRHGASDREANLLALLTEALPHLRTGLTPEGAQRVAELLLTRLKVRAAAFVDTDLLGGKTVIALRRKCQDSACGSTMSGQCQDSEVGLASGGSIG